MENQTIKRSGDELMLKIERISIESNRAIILLSKMGVTHAFIMFSYLTVIKNVRVGEVKTVKIPIFPI